LEHIMKIGHLDNRPAVTPATTERKAGTGDTPATAQTPASGEASTQVALSSSALLGGKDGTAEFDSEKVQRIAQAIRDGKFTVNPEAIADKLIANAQELLGRNGH
jgi:negative regulator of flagellin synthesis FlgM